MKATVPMGAGVPPSVPPADDEPKGLGDVEFGPHAAAIAIAAVTMAVRRRVRTFLLMEVHPLRCQRRGVEPRYLLSVTFA